MELIFSVVNTFICILITSILGSVVLAGDYIYTPVLVINIVLVSIMVVNIVRMIKYKEVEDD